MKLETMKIYVVYYNDEVALVTADFHQIPEYEMNRFRDKLEIWANGKLIETIE